ncbi:hypothetical protein IPH19_01790 [Candidatus Uhrbacteria bacterium]|nr:MAG: hypothetical protein IPH19_01790 [Candidatus Uhrbacteria bacterium]
MTKEVEESTFIEFSRTLTDAKAGFTIAVFIKLGEDGVTIGHDFGTSDGMTNATAQGQISIKSLKNLLELCRDTNTDGVGVETMMRAYNQDTRSMESEVESLQISFEEPLNFRPFLLQFLPIIIKAAELLDKSVLPQATNPSIAKC